MRAPLVGLYLRSLERLNRRARDLERERDEALDLAASLYADVHDAEQREEKVRADLMLVCAAIPEDMRDAVMEMVRCRPGIARLDEVEV